VADDQHGHRTITPGSDASTLYTGTQVRTDASGQFSFGLVAPAVPGVGTFRVQNLDASATGASAEFHRRDLATVRFQWTEQLHAVRVHRGPGSQTYSSAVGYGWSGPVAEYERSTAGIAATQPQLCQDGATGLMGTGGAGTFQVRVTPNTPYTVRRISGPELSAGHDLLVVGRGVGHGAINTSVNVFVSGR